MAAARSSRPVDYYDGKAVSLDIPEAIQRRLSVRSSLTPDSAKLILVMVGLPGRGKSFIAHKLSRFLNWTGYQTDIFNAGQNRRANHSPTNHSRAGFFDPSDAERKAKRESIAMSTFEELLEWLAGGGEIGIFDATNSNPQRRALLVSRAAEWKGWRSGDASPAAGGAGAGVAGGGGARFGVSIVFIESICTDKSILEANMLSKVRASPDFAGLSEEEALSDLRQRVSHYEASYVPVADEEGAYIKLFDLSSKVTAHQVFGRMTQRVLPYMMSLHISLRPIFLAALPPGYGDLSCEEGGCSSPNQSFALQLASWVGRHAPSSPLRLLSSTQASAVDAARVVARDMRRRGVGCSVTNVSCLNPLDRGSEAGEDQWATQRLASMGFSQRYPGGESFADLVRRLEACVLEVEASTEPVLIVAHATPCRALRAYFLGLPVAECMCPASSRAAEALANASRSVVELLPALFGKWSEEIHTLEERGENSEVLSLDDAVFSLEGQVG